MPKSQGRGQRPEGLTSPRENPQAWGSPVFLLPTFLSLACLFWPESSCLFWLRHPLKTSHKIGCVTADSTNVNILIFAFKTGVAQ